MYAVGTMPADEFLVTLEEVADVFFDGTSSSQAAKRAQFRQKLSERIKGMQVRRKPQVASHLMYAIILMRQLLLFTIMPGRPLAGSLRSVFPAAIGSAPGLDTNISCSDRRQMDGSFFSGRTQDQNSNGTMSGYA
ncbi:hypothetical protein B0H19DRAFT_1062561 [Mycena capillaripes]|nr:hypothetical protein B0H19DRAFT_1062561 [Mycena capillaripes]